MAVDSVDELRKCHVHSYTITLDNVEMAKQFANDFDGIRDGQNVTVSPNQVWSNLYALLWR